MTPTNRIPIWLLQQCVDTAGLVVRLEVPWERPGRGRWRLWWTRRSGWSWIPRVLSWQSWPLKDYRMKVFSQISILIWKETFTLKIVTSFKKLTPTAFAPYWYAIVKCFIRNSRIKRPQQGVIRNQISKIIVKGGKNHWLKHTWTQPTSRTCYSSTAVKCWHCRGLSRTSRDLYKRWLDPRSWGLNIIQQSHKVLVIKLPLCHVFHTEKRMPSLLCNNSVCTLETSNTTLFLLPF